MAAPLPVLPDECLIARLPAGTRLVRVHWRSKGPIFYGPPAGELPGNRFDAPAGEFGTLYVAQGLKGAFCETVLRKAARIIAWPIVAKRSWSTIELTRELKLAKLHGDGLAWHGVTSDVCTGEDYSPSQALSLAFRLKGLDGIRYRSRHNNDELCCAIFDDVEPGAFVVVDTYDFEDHPTIANDLLIQHNAAWDPMAELPDLTKLP